MSEIVNAHDPEGLLALGAPVDEYDAEVDELAILVRGGRLSQAAVAELWFRQFGTVSAAGRSPDTLSALTRSLAALRA